MVRMPNTIGDNLQRLITAKTDIKNAIIQMGGGSDDSHGLEDFADDILTIPSGGQTEWDVTLPENETFYYYTADQSVGGGTITSDTIRFNLNLFYRGTAAQYYSVDYTNQSAYVDNLLGIDCQHHINAKMSNYFNDLSTPLKLNIECDVYVPKNSINIRPNTNTGSTAYIRVNLFGYDIFNEATSLYTYTNSEDINTHISLTNLVIPSYTLKIEGSRSSSGTCYALINEFNITNIRVKVYIPSSS
jgi:hypothetical protein